MLCPILLPCQNAPAFYESLQSMRGVGSPGGWEVRYRLRVYGVGANYNAESETWETVSYDQIVDTDGSGNSRPFLTGAVAVGPLAHPKVWLPWPGDGFDATDFPPPQIGVRRSNVELMSDLSTHAYAESVPPAGSYPGESANVDVSISARRLSIGAEDDPDQMDYVGLYNSGMFGRIAPGTPLTLVFGIADWDMPSGYDPSAPTTVNYRMRTDEAVSIEVPEYPLTWSPWSPWLRATGPSFSWLPSSTTQRSMSAFCRVVAKYGPFTNLSLPEIYGW